MSRLRDYLRSISPDLANIADNLWRLAKPIHERQNRPRNLTENGRVHVEAVEHNIFRLLSCSALPKRSNNFDVFDHPFPIFILSAAACCHDFDKATHLPAQFKHGEGSADFVVKNQQAIGLNRTQRQAIQKAISIHDLKKNDFIDALRHLKTEQAGPECSYNLRLIAVLLKAADILHADNSRILSINIVQPDKLTGLERLKYNSRNSVQGWFPDGVRITIQAEPESPEECSDVEASFHYMRSEEWPCVEDIIRYMNFPYELTIQGLSELLYGTKISSIDKGDSYEDSTSNTNVLGPKAQTIPIPDERSGEPLRQSRGEAGTSPETLRYPRLGLGAIPSRIRNPKHWGHMWLYWEKEEENSRRDYRGYYPLINRMPEQQPLAKWRDFLFENSVPGARFRDLDAKATEISFGPSCKNMNWGIDDQHLYGLFIRCWIPAGTNFVEEGWYSFDTSRPGWNNCASWVIRIVNQTMDDNNFLPLRHPARIKHVISDIWGDDAKSNQRLDIGDCS